MQLDLSTGQTLVFDRYGESSAPALLLVHGLSGNRGGYAPVVDHLVAGRVARGEWQVVNVDLRGHGESSRAALETYDAASYADDLAALIDELELAPVVVAGHSLGGVVAASLGARRPDLVRALLLEDPPMFEGDSARRNASPVAAFFPMLVAAVTDLQARNAPASEYAPLAVGSTTPEDVAARCLSLHRWDPVTMQAAVDGIVWSTFDPTATLSCPLTVLRADPKMGAVFNAADVDLVLDANPQADVHMVPGAPHSIHAVATSAYLAHLDAFLDELS